MKKLFFIFIAFAFFKYIDSILSIRRDTRKRYTISRAFTTCTSCTNKVKHDNVTQVKHCVESVEKHWGIDEITPVIPRDNRTLCCYQYDLIKFFLKYMPKTCNQQEVKQSSPIKLIYKSHENILCLKLKLFLS
jgi:hypothetical protein